MGESAQDFSSRLARNKARRALISVQQSATTNASNNSNIIIYLRTKTPAGEMFDMVLSLLNKELKVLVAGMIVVVGQTG